MRQRSRLGHRIQAVSLRLSEFSPMVVLRSSRGRQVGVLYLSLLASLVLGIAVSVINTRLLGPKAFGDFKFLQTIWIVGVLFVTLGFFTTGGNLLAERKTAQDEKPLIGSLLVLGAGISLAFILIMLVVSFPLADLYGQGLGEKIRLYAALLFVFPLQIYLQEVLRGTNDIHNLAILNALPQFAYIPAALAVNYFYGFSLDLALFLYLMSMAITVMIMLIRTQPNFSYIGEGVQEILKYNRAIGSHIYIATLVTTASGYLGQFSLAYFNDTKLVGEFALATTITMPLTMIPNVIGTVFFKHFATSDRIPTKVIVASVLLSAATLFVFLVAIKALVLFLYTDRFIQIVPLAYICAVASVMRGMGDMFNRYLLSNGQTSQLRINAIQLGVLNVFGFVFLVAWWDVTGAVMTKLVVDVAYLSSMLFYYVHRAKIA